MGLMTGNQLRAARSLVGWNQADTARHASVNVNTIRKMEGCGARLLRSNMETVRKVQASLERHGIRFAGEAGECVGVSLKLP